MIYLASPYSHPDPLIMKTRFLIVEQVTAGLMQEREFVYSPIVHCHEIADKYKLPTDFDYWKAYNIDMLKRADSMYVLDIDGLWRSKGCKGEYDFAVSAGIPVWSINEYGLIERKIEAWSE